MENKPEAPSRWLCEECGLVSDTFLVANNPFDEDDTITGCVNCKQVDSLVSACWKCNRAAGIGTPHCKEYRYIHTCFEHRPEEDRGE